MGRGEHKLRQTEQSGGDSCNKILEEMGDTNVSELGRWKTNLKREFIERFYEKLESLKS